MTTIKHMAATTIPVEPVLPGPVERIRELAHVDRCAASYRPEFLVAGEWCANAQRFATRAEAESSAKARFAVWTIPTDCRAVASDDPVNYARVEGRDASVEESAPRVPDGLPFCACGRRFSECDGSRRGCKTRLAPEDTRDRPTYDHECEEEG